MRKCIGIDVAKKHFDLHVLSTEQDLRLDNDEKGIAKCVTLCQKVQPEMIVLEATGGYEIPLAARLQADGFAVAVVNPRRIRDFARAMGQMAKTDKLDARIIAKYAEKAEPMPTERIDANTRILKGLVARRAQLVQMKTAEENRKEHAECNVIMHSIAEVVHLIEQQIREIDDEIKDHIDKQPELKIRAKVLKSIPGVGETTANMLVAEMPELGRLNRRQIAMLVGLAPINRDSGTLRGKRMTGGGRKSVRTRLFMPALVAVYHNPVLKKFYKKLIEEQGKCKMVALTAAMRKLLCIMNAMLKNNQLWQENLTF